MAAWLVWKSPFEVDPWHRPMKAEAMTDLSALVGFEFEQVDNVVDNDLAGKSISVAPNEENGAVSVQILHRKSAIPKHGHRPQHYVRCKRMAPATTAAWLILPNQVSPACAR
jgi:hypothetical protein